MITTVIVETVAEAVQYMFLSFRENIILFSITVVYFVILFSLQISSGIRYFENTWLIEMGCYKGGGILGIIYCNHWIRVRCANIYSLAAGL